MTLDSTFLNEIRRQFPVLDQQVYGKPLVYLDNAATTQKPLCVINRERDYYLHENCNIHRGVHYLSQMATEAYENARRTVADFIHAGSPHEIVFTRGTTESLNLLASSFGAATRRRTRQSAYQRHGTPFQPRPLATNASSEKRTNAGLSHGRQWRPRPTALRDLA